MVIKTGNKDLDNYLLKVILYPYKIDNEEVNKLKKHGYTEDDIFDLTANVAAAVANGIGKIDKAANFLSGAVK